MRSVFMRCLLATLLVNSAGSLVYAQDLLLPGNWPTQFRDSANTGNTPVVLGNDLKVLWEKPSPGGHQSPRLFVNRNGQHLVIAGNCIYEAGTGALVHYLPDAGDRAAITTTQDDTTDVLLTARPRDYLRNSGYEFFAYDLSSFEPLWYLDSAVNLNFDRFVQLNAKDGTFLISGWGEDTHDRVAAVDAETGTVRWQKGVWDGGVNGTAAARFDGADWVFMAQDRCGVVAFRESTTGDDAVEQWRVPYFCDLAPPCVDQAKRLVYFGALDPQDGSNKLWAYNAVSGQFVWAQTIDAILNGAPTLGWAKAHNDLNGPVHEAVFVVTGGADGKTGIYARDRLSGAELWTAWVPGEAYTSAVYSGDSSSGKLYVAVNNYSTPGNHDGSIYAFDALTGEQLQRLLATNFHEAGQPCPVIAEVQGLDQYDEPVTEGVLYFRNGSGNVAAWSPSGTNPDPPAPVIQSLSPEIDPIAVNSSTKVFATVIDQSSEPITGAEVWFSCNAANNQGYVFPRSFVYTNANGVATTTFFSERRTGTITVTATTRGSNAVTATTTINVVKGTGEEPPPPTDTGSIQGGVYTADGKPARKVPVELYEAPWTDPTALPVAVTATNPKGKYRFEGVTFGDYVVFAFTDDQQGMTGVSISEEAPAVTSPEGDVDLVEDAPL